MHKPQMIYIPGDNPGELLLLDTDAELADTGGDEEAEYELSSTEGLLLFTSCCNTTCEACGSLDCNQV